MAVKTMQWVWDHSRSKGSCRLVLLAIADCANEQGENAYPSVTELCRKTGMGERTVQDALKWLSMAGELIVKWNRGPRGCNLYQVVMPPADSAPPPQILRGSLPESVEDQPVSTPPQILRGSLPESVEDQPVSTPADSAPPPQILRPTPADSAGGTKREPKDKGSAPKGAPPNGQVQTTQVLIGEWIDHCPRRPANQLVGQVAKQVGTLLEEGFEYELVRRGLQQWHQKGLHPSALPSVLHEVMIGPRLRRPGRPERERDPSNPEDWQ